MTTIYLIMVFDYDGGPFGNYVGRTRQLLSSRIAMHLKKDLPIDRIMRTHPYLYFELEVCDDDISPEREMYYIEALGTYYTHPYGYNHTKGGEPTVYDYDMEEFREAVTERSSTEEWRMNQSLSQRMSKSSDEYKSQCSQSAKENYSDEDYVRRKAEGDSRRGDPEYETIVEYADGMEPRYYKDISAVTEHLGLTDSRSFKKHYINKGKPRNKVYYARLCDYRKMVGTEDKEPSE